MNLLNPLFSPLLYSHQLLHLLGTRLFVYHPDRIPQAEAMIVVSNHRSFMDAPLLMAALDRSISFACHHYMGQVPLLRDFVNRLGCFPLDAPGQRQRCFLQRANQLLEQRKTVGIFPEGTQPMVTETDPYQVGHFYRGFAHLAFQAPVPDLAVLPVAIAAETESSTSVFPVRWLSWFDPSEPLFQQSGWHPMVVYRRVNVYVGRPVWIQELQFSEGQRKQTRTAIHELNHYCHTEIETLLAKAHLSR